MKLIIAIIQDEFSQEVVKVLIDEKIRATKLSSTGGFLKSGNTTLLIGVEEDELVAVIDLIRKVCKSPVTDEENGDIEVRGANLFILDIDGHERI